MRGTIGWRQIIVASGIIDTFESCLSSAFWSTTVLSITNTEYAIAALTVHKAS
jgi:hypothetical protein